MCGIKSADLPVVQRGCWSLLTNDQRPSAWIRSREVTTIDLADLRLIPALTASNALIIQDISKHRREFEQPLRIRH